jgi:Protein of unknown function (DUF3344)
MRKRFSSTVLAVGLSLLVAMIGSAIPVLATTTDNPLTEGAFTIQGNVDVLADGVGVFLGSLATTTTSNLTVALPPGSAIEKAFLYFGGIEIDDLPVNSAAASINGVGLGTLLPISTNIFSSAPNVIDNTYRWDATSAVVSGVNNLSITTSAPQEHLSHLLLVIFSNPTLPLRRVIVNDGAELIENTTATTSFPNVATGSGKLINAVFAGDIDGPGEAILFNGDTIVCCTVWDQSSGPHLDLDTLSVTTINGTNTASISTGIDIVIWQLAVLVAGPLAPANTIQIDIKPGSFPNSINPRSEGRTPVAILRTDSFDATTVDPATVLFGRTGTEAAPVDSALEDVDGDGDTDMILHFNTKDTGIVCGDTSASLTGETLSGQPIEGSDSIKTVGCK